jgi:murein L,D-transpeptidase YafK
MLVGCSQPEVSKFSSYSGEPVSHVIIQKTQRRMYIMSQKDILATYKIDLGFNPQGHKLQAGDGRTPEGWSRIDRENRNSRYYLSLGINYPNAKDRAASKAAGVEPGGDIFIHGGPRYDGESNKRDWTAGCVSVTDTEMREIFAMVPVGTWVKINP